jgi:hypothetical protein
MAYEEGTAFRYRAHAKELRTIADMDRMEETRQALLRVADSYDAMAEKMELIAEGHRLINGHHAAGAKA